MKMEYPRYSYPSYKNRIDHTTGVSKAVEAGAGSGFERSQNTQ